MSKLTEESPLEPRPPECVCCEYMRVCEQDRENGQKLDYCPDPAFRKWLFSKSKEVNNE